MSVANSSHPMLLALLLRQSGASERQTFHSLSASDPEEEKFRISRSMPADPSPSTPTTS
ncbi:hypothetical protein PGT21_036309 [Puccinia graminis f. sp. tritici]|uniref:Uncharacterized protein n=1 Tax=Puccinia graminis f. sp. tritici TaxID=56615 RepID=A0A5B0NIQ5_PUCGR|nr:hypothetical protein PGT21_036309 [Puccinia graminis f. sp. tritici]